MKKLAWLFVLPYLLMVSKDTGKYTCEQDEINYPEYLCQPPNCDFLKDRCEDFAAALNEAHERRTAESAPHDPKCPKGVIACGGRDY